MTQLPLASPQGTPHHTVRRSNLALVLGSLRDNGAQSRAQLAADLELNKATVSSLVTELLGRGLAREGSTERGGVGRPGTLIELDGGGAFGVGAEVGANHISVRGVDLAGRTVSEGRASFGTWGSPPRQVVDRLAQLLARTLGGLPELGAPAASVVVAIAGQVEHERGTVSVGAEPEWQDISFAEMVRDRLQRPGHPIRVESSATLEAVAEVNAGDPDRRDIVAIHGSECIRGGIVIDGRPRRGRLGFAGELGHMTVDRGGRTCRCGRIGCWETVIGSSRLVDLATSHSDLLRAPHLRLEARVREINRRAHAGDQRSVEALREVGRWIGIGAAMVVNALDPGTIVLAGYLGEVGGWMLEDVEDEMRSGVFAPRSGGTRIALSGLGGSGAVHGGAAVAIGHVFDDPASVPRIRSLSAVSH